MSITSEVEILADATELLHKEFFHFQSILDSLAEPQYPILFDFDNDEGRLIQIRPKDRPLPDHLVDKTFFLESDFGVTYLNISYDPDLVKNGLGHYVDYHIELTISRPTSIFNSFKLPLQEVGIEEVLFCLYSN